MDATPNSRTKWWEEVVVKEESDHKRQIKELEKGKKAQLARLRKAKHDALRERIRAVHSTLREERALREVTESELKEMSETAAALSHATGKPLPKTPSLQLSS